MKSDIYFRFKSREAAEQFITWLCDQGGEQVFCNAVEQAGKKPLVNNFDYRDFFKGGASIATTLIEEQEE